MLEDIGSVLFPVADEVKIKCAAFRVDSSWSESKKNQNEYPEIEFVNTIHSYGRREEKTIEREKEKESNVMAYLRCM